MKDVNVQARRSGSLAAWLVYALTFVGMASGALVFLSITAAFQKVRKIESTAIHNGTARLDTGGIDAAIATASNTTFWIGAVSAVALVTLASVLLRIIRQHIRDIDDANQALDSAATAAREAAETLRRSEAEARKLTVAEDRSERQLSDFFETAPVGFQLLSAKGEVLRANRTAMDTFGYSPESLDGKSRTLFTDTQQFDVISTKLRADGKLHDFEAPIKCKDGVVKDVLIDANILWENDVFIHIRLFTRDITSKKQAEREWKMMEVQLRQAQKLESIGQLAAGIAHEINTPTQYIGDNTRFVKESFAEIQRLLAAYAEFATAARDGKIGACELEKIEAAEKTADIEYLAREIPAAIEQSLEGLQRVTEIMGAMKEFSHPSKEEKTNTDINHAIWTTLTVARNTWKYVANVKTDFSADLPPVPVLRGAFNQVILNLVVNAAQAIGDVVDGIEGKGTITISTKRDGEDVEIRIADTGRGMPKSVQARIFEPFFTTKDVGKGTGQGLAISRSVVCDKHGGTIRFESVENKGTTFIVRLPLVNRGTPHSPNGALQSGEFIRV